VVAAAGVLGFVLQRQVNSSSELAERRLTFDSSAREVASAVISPDGKHLAYTDPGSIHVRLLSTGEERLIPPSAVAPAGAFSWIDSWFPNGTELLGHSREAGGRESMWFISIMGLSSGELRAGAMGWSVSPDGSRIAFSPANASNNQPEIWVMDDHGEHQQKVFGLTAGDQRAGPPTDSASPTSEHSLPGNGWKPVTCRERIAWS
jgi:WD40-like Beta Propeller Repeat